MSFPLYRRPGTVIFLDDDIDYLEMLAEVMPDNWFVHLMLRPVACIDMLLEETTFRELDLWRQQQIINRWRDGASLIPQILKYWREDGIARFTLAQVCVVDYSMPAMSGLKVLDALAHWSGSRILLTGRADEQLAVSAFNSGLIQQFIPKQSPDIRERLTSAIQGLLHKFNLRDEQTWRATFSREQNLLIGDPLSLSSLKNWSPSRAGLNTLLSEHRSAYWHWTVWPRPCGYSWSLLTDCPNWLKWRSRKVTTRQLSSMFVQAEN